MSSEALSSRDRLGLVFGGGAVAVVVLFAFYIALMDGKGTYPRYKKSSDRLASVQSDLELANLKKFNELARIAGGAELEARLEARDPRFDLFSYMNGILDTCGLQGRAQLVNNPTMRYVRGGENLPTVQLTLTTVSLKELVDFLHRVYASRSLIVLHKCVVSPNDGEQGLRCELTFQTIRG